MVLSKNRRMATPWYIQRRRQDFIFYSGLLMVSGALLAAMAWGIWLW